MTYSPSPVGPDVAGLKTDEEQRRSSARVPCQRSSPSFVVISHVGVQETLWYVFVNGLQRRLEGLHAVAHPQLAEGLLVDLGDHEVAC